MQHLKSALEKVPAYWLSIFIYFICVELILLFKSGELYFSNELWTARLVFLVIFGFNFLPVLSSKTRSLCILFLSYAAMTLLYKETAELNKLFYPVADPILMNWDQVLFGFQPAIEFTQKWNAAWFSELMFFGYFSYYLVPLIVIYLVYKYVPEKIEEFGLILISSFLIYYLVFILFPAVGPQFYFEPPNHVTEARGIFGRIIKIIQHNGEVPTGAFPSSHVGISLIIFWWVWRHLRRFAIYFVPALLCLIPATVYIKAHYAVDVIAGFCSAPIVYFLIQKSYGLFRKWYKSDSIELKSTENNL